MATHKWNDIKRKKNRSTDNAWVRGELRKKRNLFGELVEGVAAMRTHSEGKVTLRTTRVPRKRKRVRRAAKRTRKQPTRRSRKR